MTDSRSGKWDKREQRKDRLADMDFDQAVSWMKKFFKRMKKWESF